MEVFIRFNMRINHNITSLNAYLQFSQTNLQLNKCMEKLTSVFRVNKAGDAAWLSISSKVVDKFAE